MPRLQVTKKLKVMMVRKKRSVRNTTEIKG